MSMVDTINMLAIDEYKLSHRHGEKNYRITRAIGIIPLGLTLLLMLAHGKTTGPGLWFSLGFTCSLEFVLRGAHDIHATKRHAFEITTRLIQTSDQWFPLFIAGTRWIFASITILILWFTLCDLGSPHTPAQDALLFLLLLMWPIRPFLQTRQITNFSFNRDLFIDFFGYLMIFLVTLFIVRNITFLLLPPGKPLTTDVPGTAILLWTPTVLVGFACIILFVHRVIQKKAAWIEDGKKQDSSQ